ncbi:MAG: serine/threonine-protein kinase [Sandaracinus sp.]
MPQRFGKYTLIRKLALGGMAEIFLALQRSMAGFEKLIVVKRVLPHLAKDQAFIELLLTEARIAATLNHPNVAHIYDVGEVGGQFYIAMEHIHGEDLRSIVRQMKKVNETSFPLEHAIAIVLGCCAGLAYAHEKTSLDGQPMEIVHRDVSPQNILVTFTGDVKLVDFGIAKAGRSTQEDTSSGQLKGKIPYMSPEQAQGLPLDGRSDVFSVGVILFELCTGKRLFRGASEMETLKMIVEGEYPRPRALNPNLPERLEKIILKSLEKDLSARYQSAREMQADLEDMIRAEQMKVSPLVLGSWMQHLFEEKLAEQKRMLAEGRQLAEVIAAQVAAEEAEAAREATRSGVRARQRSRVPWILTAVFALLTIAVVAYFAIFGVGGRPTGPGVLVVESEPPGASIRIDGEVRAEHTPATIEELPLAHYTVTVTSEGYVPFTQELDLTDAAQRATVHAALVRPSASSYGVASVTTTPAGAHLLLDGRDTTLVTPATVPEIEPGVEHTLVISLDGYVPITRTLLLTAGQVETITLPLERTPLGPTESLLVLTTDPPDSRVQLDAQWYETGSPFEIRVPAREYRLRVTHAGRRMDEQDLTLEGGQRRELSITLERERTSGPRPTGGGGDDSHAAPSGPGHITINATPWCNVSIDGHAVGETPIVEHTLPSGAHTVVCTNPETHATRTVRVEVHAGETTRTRITL